MLPCTGLIHVAHALVWYMLPMHWFDTCCLCTGLIHVAHALVWYKLPLHWACAWCTMHVALGCVQCTIGMVIVWLTISNIKEFKGGSNGHCGTGLSGNRLSGNGLSGNGLSGNGLSCSGLSGNGLSDSLFGGNRILGGCNSKEFKGAGNRHGGNSCKCKPMVLRLGTIGCGDCQGPCDQMALI